LFILLLLLAVIAVDVDACNVKKVEKVVVVVFQPDAVATIESNQIKSRKKGPIADYETALKPRVKVYNKDYS